MAETKSQDLTKRTDEMLFALVWNAVDAELLRRNSTSDSDSVYRKGMVSGAINAILCVSGLNEPPLLNELALRDFVNALADTIQKLTARSDEKA